MIRITFSLALRYLQNEIVTMKKLHFLLLVSAVGFSFINDAWKEVKSEDEIIVYNTQVMGFKFKKSKAETTIKNGDLAKAENILKDVKNYKNWMHNCSSSKLLKTEGEKLFIQLIFDAPWPITGRELIIESNFKSSNNQLEVISKAIPNYIPSNEDYVRIELSNGLWQFNLKKNGNVFIRNTNHSNPGGNIPVWLSTTAVEDIPLETMQEMVKLMNK